MLQLLGIPLDYIFKIYWRIRTGSSQWDWAGYIILIYSVIVKYSMVVYSHQQMRIDQVWLEFMFYVFLMNNLSALSCL